MALSDCKARKIARVIVDAVRAVDVRLRWHPDRHYVDFVCYWFSSQGWTPWQIKDLDAVALVAQTAVLDGVRFIPPSRGPETWHPDWRRIAEVGSELAAVKPPSTSKALNAVPTPVVRVWLQAARLGGGMFRPRGWGRDFTIENLVAELSQRPDRQAPTKEQRRAARREKAREAHQARQGFKRPPGWRNQ